MYVFKEANFNDLHLVIHPVFWQDWFGFCLGLFSNAVWRERLSLERMWGPTGCFGQGQDRNIYQGLIIPMGSHGCVMVTPSIVRVSLNIHEDLTKLVVDWVGAAAMFLDMKCRAAYSGDACTWISVCGMLGSFSLSLTGIQIRNDSIKLNSNCLWLCQLTT